MVRIEIKETEDAKRWKQTEQELSNLVAAAGFQAGENFYETEDGTIDVLAIAAINEFGVPGHIPERPFMRQAAENNEDRVYRAAGNAVRLMINEGMTAQTAMQQMSLLLQKTIQESIVKGPFTPNAPSTIRRKKSTKPLIDTGRMRQSVGAFVKDKGELD